MIGQSKQPYSTKYLFRVIRENMKIFNIKSTPEPRKFYYPLKSLGKDDPKYSIKRRNEKSLFSKSDSLYPDG